MSKSKTLKIAFHLAKICLEARFSTSFALLQSTWTKKNLFKRSSNFEMHKTIDKISFLIAL